MEAVLRLGDYVDLVHYVAGNTIYPGKDGCSILV
jgi:hypothetical protein